MRQIQILGHIVDAQIGVRRLEAIADHALNDQFALAIVQQETDQLKNSKLWISEFLFLVVPIT